MSRWSSAGMDDEGDDAAFESDLFVRRARAQGPAVIPSLEHVLRAAEASEDKHSSRETRGRVMAAVMAAACMVAAVTRLPAPSPARSPSHSIGAEPHARAASSVSSVEPPPAGECTMSDAVAASEERARVSSAPLFTPVPECTTDEAPRECTAEESCTITTQ